MEPEVSYILALPILQPASRYFPPSRVAAILYLDSKCERFCMTEAEVRRISAVVAKSFSSLEMQSERMLLGVRNISTVGESSCESPPEEECEAVKDSIEYLPLEIAPVLSKPFVMNFDYADPASTGRAKNFAEQGWESGYERNWSRIS